MIDLSTTYLGLSLANPLVAPAGPLCEGLDNVRRMEDAGAAAVAVVLHSPVEEQIEVEGPRLDWYLSHGEESYAETEDEPWRTPRVNAPSWSRWWRTRSGSGRCRPSAGAPTRRE